MARPLHPFEVVARILGAWLHRPHGTVDLGGTIGRRSASWDAVVAQASRHHVLAALAGTLFRLGLTPWLEPDLAGFLAAFLDANRTRNQLLHLQLAEVAADLNGVAVIPVLLKGAVRLVDGLYPDPGWRMMRDLDLLVPAAQLADAVSALRARGYVEDGAPGEPSPSPEYGHHHHPRLVRPDRAAPIELHTELFSARRHARLRRLLTASELIAASLPTTVGGAAARKPTSQHQLVHLIAHGQIAHGGHACGSVLLNDRFEAATLARQVPDEIDWSQLLGRFAALGYQRPLLAFLLALRDGGLCRIPLPRHPDPLMRLQERRFALVARSERFAEANVRLAALTDSLRQGTTRKRSAQTERSPDALRPWAPQSSR